MSARNRFGVVLVSIWCVLLVLAWSCVPRPALALQTVVNGFPGSPYVKSVTESAGTVTIAYQDNTGTQATLTIDIDVVDHAATLPASPSVGDAIVLTAADGANAAGWYVCTTAGTWSAVAGTSGGLTAVTSDATLSGDGTSGSPLSVANDAITSARIVDGAVTAADLETATANRLLPTGRAYPAAVTQAEAEAGTVTADRTWSPERVKQAVENLAASLTLTHHSSTFTPSLTEAVLGTTSSPVAARQVTLAAGTLDSGQGLSLASNTVTVTRAGLYHVDIGVRMTVSTTGSDTFGGARTWPLVYIQVSGSTDEASRSTYYLRAPSTDNNYPVDEQYRAIHATLHLAANATITLYMGGNVQVTDLSAGISATGSSMRISSLRGEASPTTEGAQVPIGSETGRDPIAPNTVGLRELTPRARALTVADRRVEATSSWGHVAFGFGTAMAGFDVANEIPFAPAEPGIVASLTLQPFMLQRSNTTWTRALTFEVDPDGQVVLRVQSGLRVTGLTAITPTSDNLIVVTTIYPTNLLREVTLLSLPMTGGALELRLTTAGRLSLHSPSGLIYHLATGGTAAAKQYSRALLSIRAHTGTDQYTWAMSLNGSGAVQSSAITLTGLDTTQLVIGNHATTPTLAKSYAGYMFDLVGIMTASNLTDSEAAAFTTAPGSVNRSAPYGAQRFVIRETTGDSLYAYAPGADLLGGAVINLPYSSAHPPVSISLGDAGLETSDVRALVFDFGSDTTSGDRFRVRVPMDFLPKRVSSLFADTTSTATLTHHAMGVMGVQQGLSRSPLANHWSMSLTVIAGSTRATHLNIWEQQLANSLSPTLRNLRAIPIHQ